VRSLVLIAVLAGAVCGAALAVPRALTPAHFQAKPGWHVGNGQLQACPGVPRSRCVQVGSWAATVRWRDCSDCAVPHRTLAHLPAGGVAIFLLLAGETHPPTNPLAWPPRLRARDIGGPIEGAPRRIGTFQRAGLLGRYGAQLFVYFGRRHPTQRQLRHAQAELNSAKLP
jgi:hypothetical protein